MEMMHYLLMSDFKQRLKLALCNGLWFIQMLWIKYS